jgi:L-serine dehydratase
MLSSFDLFKVGLGPSSSHTTGPMKAALRFVSFLQAQPNAQAVAKLDVRLYGSLALTGAGHHTDRAIMLGLCGLEPETIEPAHADAVIETIHSSHCLKLGGKVEIDFTPPNDIRFEGQTSLPFHTNGLRFSAFDDGGDMIASRIYYSIGGGFVVDEEEAGRNAKDEAGSAPKHPFSNAQELLARADDVGLSIAQLMLENECALRPRADVLAGLDKIWGHMRASMENGLTRGGKLPGALDVRRRAGDLYTKLKARDPKPSQSCERSDWVNLWAMAVNEENASGGRVVTAPTNGAAGVIPAVINYYLHFVAGANADGVRRFLLTAAAIGGLYKRNASISGAEVGCQGEVGVACSMAAGALAAVLGGTNAQIENAAEIGMEHNLGMTCDPVGGLVQIPCIERNAFGAAMAIQAARLAMLGDGQHAISLDEVIKTMFETGRDMSSKYKETSQGGLAVNIVEC